MDFATLMQIIPKHPFDWSKQDVSHWLEFIKLPNLISSFQKLKIDGKRLLLIREQEFMGKVKASSIAIKKIMNWVKYGLPAYQEFLSNNIITQSTDFQSHRSKRFKEPFTEDQFESKSSSVSTAKDIVNSPQLFNDTLAKKRSSLAQFSDYFSIPHLILQELNGVRCHDIVGDANIGRMSDSQIHVPSMEVDPLHCSIKFIAGHYILQPGQSQKGRGTWVKVFEKFPFTQRIDVEMGDNVFLIVAYADHVDLQITSGDNKGDKFSFSTSKVTIGRRLSSQISFPIDCTLSGLHAKLTKEDGIWSFQDLNSTNGSWILLKDKIKIQNQMVFKLGLSDEHHYKCKIVNPEDTRMKKEKQKISVMKCIICKNRERNSFFSPCCHSVCCYECSLLSISCPLCNKVVFQAIKIYIV